MRPGKMLKNEKEDFSVTEYKKITKKSRNCSCFSNFEMFLEPLHSPVFSPPPATSYSFSPVIDTFSVTSRNLQTR